MVLSKENKAMVVDFLLDELNPQLIYLYGTYAHSQGRADSDVDLVNLNSASTVFRAQVVTDCVTPVARKKSYFVDEKSEAELQLVLAAGFEIHERARCYSLILR